MILRIFDKLLEELYYLYKTLQLSKQRIRYHLVMVLLTHLITCNFIKENTSIGLRFFVKKEGLHATRVQK